MQLELGFGLWACDVYQLSLGVAEIHVIRGLWSYNLCTCNFTRYTCTCNRMSFIRTLINQVRRLNKHQICAATPHFPVATWH